MIRRALWLLVVYLIMQAWKWFRAKSSHQLIMQLAARKIANRWACNVNALGLERVPDEMRVLQMSVSQLREAMQAGELTSTQLVSTYIRRCAHFGRLLNASTAELFQDALRAAKVKESQKRKTQAKIIDKRLHIRNAMRDGRLEFLLDCWRVSQFPSKTVTRKQVCFVVFTVITHL